MNNQKFVSDFFFEEVFWKLIHKFSLMIGFEKIQVSYEKNCLEYNILFMP